MCVCAFVAAFLYDCIKNKYKKINIKQLVIIGLISWTGVSTEAEVLCVTQVCHGPKVGIAIECWCGLYSGESSFN